MADTKILADDDAIWRPTQTSESSLTSLITSSQSNTTQTSESSLTSQITSKSSFELLLLENEQYVVNINGYVSPLLVVFTIVTNGFICLVLLKPHMRTPTNALLVAIAMTDTMTGIWPLPCYVFFYTFRNCYDWVPFDWCPAFLYLTEYLPTISHTASIWLTVILALQRYVCICHFQSGRRWFSVAQIFKAIMLVYAAAILTHISRFFERGFSPINVTSLVDDDVTVTACVDELVPFVASNADVYYNVYYWFRVVFINLVPCGSLLILSILLIATLRSAQRRKIRLLGRQKSDSSHQKQSDSNSTTLMLIFVVGLFLLVEFPLAILFIILIVQNTFDVHIMANSDMNLATSIVNLLILFSYPVNFFIYCAMSRKFRETFVMMISRRRRASNASSNTQYYSLATEAESRAMQAGKQDAVAQTGC